MYLKDSYFSLLSNEILIKILQYVTSFDLLQFCEAYNAEEFLKVNTIVKTINFDRQYKLTQLKTINKKLKLSYITTLNINGLYWLDVTDLRRFLRKLTNLKVLLAIDTPLELTKKDIAIYKSLKLTKLAISIREKVIKTKTVLSTIETLLIIRYTDVIIPWSIFPALKSLWFENIERINSGSINTKVGKLLVKTRQMFTTRGSQYLTHRLNQMMLYYGEIIDRKLSKIVENDWPLDWQMLRAFRPFSYRTFDALRQKNIKTVMIDELNCHRKSSMCRYFSTTYKRILSAAYCEQLKKLSLNLCLMLCDHLTQTMETNDEGMVVKKRRLDVDDQCRFFEKHLLYNCRLLKVVELYLCDEIVESSIDELHHSLSILCHLKQLQHLSIEIPRLINGKFLINVLNHCQQLKVLKITSSFRNDELNLNLCQALLTAHNLKDFKLKTKHIELLQFLTVFSDMNKSKLERISLICDEIDETEISDYAIVERFLDSNPQLIFVYFNFDKCSMEIYQSINSILRKIARQHPARYYLLTSSIVEVKNSIMPHMFYEDMVAERSIVSYPDAFEDFKDF